MVFAQLRILPTVDEKCTIVRDKAAFDNDGERSVVKSIACWRTMSGIVKNEDARIVVAGALVDHVAISAVGNGIATSDVSVDVIWGDLCCC